MNCDDYAPLVTFLPAVERVIVMGDIHGDLQLAIRLFKMAHLIDHRLQWIAQPASTVVVQVGDQLDGCRPTSQNANIHGCDKQSDTTHNEDLSVIQFFDAMHVKAQAQGGAVYSLLGNHELMNIQNDFRYVSYGSHEYFHYVDKNTKQEYIGPQGREQAFARGAGALARHLGCTRPSIMMIGRNMFVHAGLLAKYEKTLQGSIANLNQMVQDWILGKIQKSAWVNDLQSPFWLRSWGEIQAHTALNQKACATVKESMKIYQANHIIIGHTPQMNEEGINGTCYDEHGNHLFRVDGGFAKVFKHFQYHSEPQLLEILNDDRFNIIRA